MIGFPRPNFHASPHFARWAERRRADEAAVVGHLLALVPLSDAERADVSRLARELVGTLRERGSHSRLEAMLSEYNLSSEEGLALMGLAEALLRIPDDDTIDLLIEELVGSGAWQGHVGHSDSGFVNASTWGLVLTGRLVQLNEGENALNRLLHRGGMPLIREALRHAMTLVGEQFVLAESIDEALRRVDHGRPAGLYSFDMLGEAALTAADADRYLAAYAAAIDALAEHQQTATDPLAGHGVSVKLSALHPRLDASQADAMLPELAARVTALAERARHAGVGITIDAEETERLDLTLDLFGRVLAAPELEGWHGLGLALQAYQKCALDVVDWLADLARDLNRRIPVRLVKGAYWDREIKRAQQLGLRNYPVFTRKTHTDLNYLVCAGRLLAERDLFAPQFATHNAHTVAAILTLDNGQPIEFQRLFGMGEALFDLLRSEGPADPRCRIYAPVGRHTELLPYLIRRLLENGANSSFVNRLADPRLSLEALTADPIREAGEQPEGHPRIALPRRVLGNLRDSALGPDLDDAVELTRLADEVTRQAPAYDAIAPAPTAIEDIERIQRVAQEAQPEWDRTPVADRADILDNAADFMEQELPGLVYLLATEAGKTLADGVAEVREAADFCRYYAQQARTGLPPQPLPAGNGELNALHHTGRGVFACISPWNFPLAIFTGQVTAALVAGNAVIAKPASQTPRTALAAVRLLVAAGVPEQVLQATIGAGGQLGAHLVGDPRIAGVAFTGSTTTAHAINRTLAARDTGIPPFIAETGGQNAMIVDSTALPEQVVRDVIDSSFRSAGQRCSALRVLYLQQEIADHVLDLLAGAMAELRIGDPLDRSSDVGPVIDRTAQRVLLAHAQRMEDEAHLLYRCDVPPDSPPHHFVPPQAFEIDHIAQIGGEVFGPILHVRRFAADAMGAVVDEINGTGFGLTFGVHSRLLSRAHELSRRITAGNCYVNRNMIGATVGSQPFGGTGLSGTGPKAGGPRYLYRFCNERTISINTMATGGDPGLLTLGE